MKIVLTGIQWCGKWTQARILVEKHWFTLLEMWQELRKIIASWSDLWNKLKEIMDAWNLVPGEIVWEVMKEILSNQINEKLLLDWFVRNEANKKSLEELIPDHKVLFFNLSEEKAIKRLISRMYDPLSWETFSSDIAQNPKTWTKLEKRKDDNEASILKRIKEFTNKTLPVVEKQKLEWKVIEVNADQAIEDVSKEIEKKLWL